MRRLLFLLLALVACAAPLQARELHVAVGVQDRSRPSGSTGERAQSGGLSAFNEDLAREICRRINARCRIADVVFAEILDGVEAGRFDLGFGNFLRTPEREKRVAFSDGIWRSSSRLIGYPATAARFAEGLGQGDSLSDLRRARIVTVVNSMQQARLKQLADKQELTVLTGNTMDEVFAMVRDGQADFSLMPMVSAYAMLNRAPATGLQYVGAPLVDNGLGGSVHIALARDAEALRRDVNRGIAAMRADGTYHRIVRRHFPFSLD